MARLAVYSRDGKPRLVRVRHAAAPFDDAKHPRGKPANAGEFRSKAEVAASTPAGRASAPAARTASLYPGGKAPPLAAHAARKRAADSNPGRRNAVGFVSPETGEGLKLSDAIVGVMEDRQRHAQRLFAEVDRRLGMRTSVDPGIGDWAPAGQAAGAEPTTVTTYRTAPDFHAVLYATAVKAYAANQHAALAFGCDPRGKDRLWSMEVASDLSGLRDVLDRHGIEFRTVRLSNGGKHQVLIYDEGGRLADKVKAAADAMGVRPGVRLGRGRFLGGDGSDRRRARESYRRLMRTYERRYPERPHWDWSRS